LLVDNWLEIHVQSGKLGEKMLYVTQQLRHALACCLASRLATCSHSTVAEAAEKAVQAGRDDDGAHGGGGGGELGQAADEDLPELLASLREEVKRKSFVRELELQTKLADLLELDVKHSASVCARSKVLWQLLHPEARSLGRGSEAMHRAMQEARTAVGAEGQIDEEQLERLKGGVQGLRGHQAAWERTLTCTHPRSCRRSSTRSTRTSTRTSVWSDHESMTFLYPPRYATQARA
jgi:hypothetical protein